MPRSHASTAEGSDRDAGSAAVEFILLGLVLLVPIFYLVVVLAHVQGYALAVESGARHIARTVAVAGDARDADAAASRVLEALVAEYGLDADVVDVEVGCRPAGVSCPRAGATVHVVMRADASLPFVPPVLGLDRLARIPVEATSVQRVARVRGSD
jgi:Flp pilus assembly protein TadG